jgi:hypothetical protein
LKFFKNRVKLYFEGRNLEYLKEEITEAKKILFTGLDDAGKSAIINSLQKEFSKIANIQPTKGAQRRIFKFLGKEISEWDLGGQVSYRISYLKNPSKFFAGTEIAIYVIDIQNNQRISESLSYLNDVISEFKKLNISPPLNIFFHKFDPKLLTNIQNKLNNLSLDLMKKIKNEINYLKVNFFKTSIYNISTIMTAMSQVLLDLYPKSDLIKKTIKEFSEKLNCEGLVLIDNNSLIIGSYYKDMKMGELITRATPYFLSLNDNFQIEGMEPSDEQMVIHRYNKYFLFKQLKMEENEQPYYIIVLKNDNPWDLYFSQKEFNTFMNILQDIINQ